MKISAFCTSILLTGAAFASAGIVNLTPQADVDVRSSPPGTVGVTGFNRNILKIENRAVDPTTNECGKAYIRFQLPGDFGVATNATFTMTRAVAPSSGAWTYGVYGLTNQGAVAGSPWTELTWPELDGGNNTTATTWFNAPGNVTNSPSGFTNATLLGTFVVKTAAQGGVVGDSYSISGANLVSFLNADTNGFVTLLVSRSTYSASSSVDQFASKENVTYAAPTLNIGYIASSNLPAKITSQPAPTSQTLYATINASFTATAAGTSPITNQWLFNGTSLVDGPHVSGANSNTLTLLNLTPEMAGSYSLLVTNGYGGEISSNATLSVSPAAIYFNAGQLSNTWNLLPGDRPYLNTLFTERGLAFNPLTTNLLVVSSLSNTVSGWVAVLDGVTATDKYYLNCYGVFPGVGSSTLALNMIGVGSDGAVYAAGQAINLTNASYHYIIYRWADDGPGTLPSQVFFGDPGEGTIPGLRWGDNFAVRGSGPDTQILIAPASGTNVAILRTTDATDFQNQVPPAIIAVSGVTNSGFAERGLAFGPGTNTFWAKNYGNVLYLIQYDLDTQTGTVLHAYSLNQVPGAFVGLCPNESQTLLAGVSLDSVGQNVQLYDISDLDAGPSLRSQSFYTTQNANVAGGAWASTAFNGNNLFALNVNNGIKAFVVDTNWTPVLPFNISNIVQGAGAVILNWQSSAGHNYQVQARTSVSSGAWLNVGSPVTAVDTSTSFTNSVSDTTNLFYRVQGL